MKIADFVEYQASLDAVEGGLASPAQCEETKAVRTALGAYLRELANRAENIPLQYRQLSALLSTEQREKLEATFNLDMEAMPRIVVYAPTGEVMSHAESVAREEERAAKEVAVALDKTLEHPIVVGGDPLGR